jgi:hypothetical protein
MKELADLSVPQKCRCGTQADLAAAATTQTGCVHGSAPLIGASGLSAWRRLAPWTGLLPEAAMLRYLALALAFRAVGVGRVQLLS